MTRCQNCLAYRAFCALCINPDRSVSAFNYDRGPSKAPLHLCKKCVNEFWQKGLDGKDVFPPKPGGAWPLHLHKCQGWLVKEVLKKCARKMEEACTADPVNGEGKAENRRGEKEADEGFEKTENEDVEEWEMIEGSNKV